MQTPPNDSINPATVRYDTIDLARGWALLGVAVINVQALARGWTNHYSLDLATTWYDVLAEYLIGTVFAHRAFPTLAFLLGVGLAYQWRSLTADPSVDPARARSTIRARYAALLLLGLAHALILWPGDIVSCYAVVALVLLWKWPISARWLVRWIGIFLLALFLVYVDFFYLWLSAEEPPSASRRIPSFAISDWFLAVSAQPKEFLMYGASQLMLPELWLAILFGAWLGQSGKFDAWLSDPSKRVGRWFALGAVMFLIGTALELASSRLGAWDFAAPSWPGVGLFMVGLPLVAFSSVFIVLAVARAWSPGRLRWLRSAFIAAGRAPLTLFFGMSFIMVSIFHKAFIGWHGELGRATYTMIAAATFFLLAGFVRAWLSAGHTRGPLEIVWMRVASLISRSPT